MISREHALTRVRQWASQAGRPETEFGLYEFDEGWVAWPVEPPPADPTRPPESTGTPRVVVDKQNGSLSLWPSQPAPVIARRYANERAPDDRFPPEVRKALTRAGWLPGRNVSDAIDDWLAEKAEALAPFTLSEPVRAFLTEFGGLILEQYGQRGDYGAGFRSRLYPDPAGGFAVERVAAISEEYGIPLFPVGTNADGPSELAIDAQGRMFLFHWAADFLLGNTPDEGLSKLIGGLHGLPEYDFDAHR